MNSLGKDGAMVWGRTGGNSFGLLCDSWSWRRVPRRQRRSKTPSSAIGRDDPRRGRRMARRRRTRRPTRRQASSGEAAALPVARRETGRRQARRHALGGTGRRTASSRRYGDGRRRRLDARDSEDGRDGKQSTGELRRQADPALAAAAGPAKVRFGEPIVLFNGRSSTLE